MLRSHRRRGAAVIVVAALLSPVTACGDDKRPQIPPEVACSNPVAVKGVAVAVGGRANSPVPVFPESLTTSLNAIIAQKEKHRGVNPELGFTVVRVDGRPSISCAEHYDPTAVADEAKKDERRKFINVAGQEMQGARAKAAESDPLGALNLAAASAGPGGTVVLVDSGLQTVPPLDFRQGDLLYQDPAAIVAALKREDRLPDLSNRTVVLSGIGYTAAPQPVLDSTTQTRLVDIWTAIVHASGALQPQVVRTPNTNQAIPGLPPVSPVAIRPVDNIQIGCGKQAIFYDGGALGFEPDKTTFRDESAARKALAPLAAFVEQNSSARMELVGTIAHYGRDSGDSGLSRDRALKVAGVLQDLGVDSSRMKARGDGWGPFPDKTAPPDAQHDQMNRRVVVSITCP